MQANTQPTNPPTFRPSRLQHDKTQRWKSQRHTYLEPIALDVLAVNAAQVPHVAASVDTGVTVEDLLVKTVARHSNPVVLARDRSEVQREDKQFVATSSQADKRAGAVLGIVAVNPAEAFLRKIDFVQRRLFPVDSIEVSNQPPDSVMPVEAAQSPVGLAIVIGPVRHP